MNETVDRAKRACLSHPILSIGVVTALLTAGASAGVLNWRVDDVDDRSRGTEREVQQVKTDVAVMKATAEATNETVNDIKEQMNEYIRAVRSAERARVVREQ